MAIYRRASGRWAVLIDVEETAFRVVVELGRDKRGRRRTKTLGRFRTHTEADAVRARKLAADESRVVSVEKGAERAEREALTSHDRGIEIIPSKITLDQLFERFIRDGEARNLSGTTLHGYRQIWKRVAPIAGLCATKLKPAHLSELYGDLARDGWPGGRGPLSVRSIGHTHTLLSTLLSWAVRLELAGRTSPTWFSRRREPESGRHHISSPTRNGSWLQLPKRDSDR